MDSPKEHDADYYALDTKDEEAKAPPKSQGEDPSVYQLIKKSYMFPYVITISYGLFSYTILRDMSISMSSLESDKRYASMIDSFSTHFIPFYAGVLLSSIIPLSKKIKSFIFTVIMVLGTILLLIEYKVGLTWSIGLMAINFSGGFFDAIVPGYLFEVSPREFFAVSGTIGYLATTLAHFVFNLIICIAYGITKKETILTALIIIAICVAIPLLLLPRYSRTPIELFTEDKKEECKEELRKMYELEDDSRRRYQDIHSVMQLTDKYKTSIFKLFLFPPNYRNALIIGIAVGLSQGITNVFFENFLCKLVDNEVTEFYCKGELYNIEKGFSYLLFLNILAILPTLAFLYYFEVFGRIKLFAAGMISTLAIIIALQVVARLSQFDSMFSWNVYFLQGILMFYTIIIYSALLGPTYMLYLPEILPISGVTIAVFGRSIGRMLGLLVLKLGTYAPAFMMFLSVFFCAFYWYIVKETRGLSEMQQFALYLSDEQKESIVQNEQANAV